MLLFAGESRELGKLEDQCADTVLDSFIILGKTANVPAEVMAIVERRPLPRECY